MDMKLTPRMMHTELFWYVSSVTLWVSLRLGCTLLLSVIVRLSYYTL